MENQSKPTTAFTNADKTSIGETWGSIQTTWASEDRFWVEASQLLENQTLEGATFLWSRRSSPWQYLLPWQVVGGMSNVSKP